MAVKTVRQKPLEVVLPDFFFPGFTNAFLSMEAKADKEVMMAKT